MLGLRRLPVALALLAALAVLAGTPAAAHKRAAFPGQSAGSRGVEVAALQHLLRAAGESIQVSGTFGGPTQAAVAHFQERNGLPVTGAVDGDTWQVMLPEVPPAAGEAVLAVQKLVNAKSDVDVPVSGTYDESTAAAVRSFQSRMGLGVSGIVDMTTWRDLLWHFTKPDFSEPGLCNYNGGNAGADWGTGSTVGMIQAAAELFRDRSGSKIAVGDVSWLHGGPIVLHATHELGLDVDIALVRRDRNQCRRPGIDFSSAQYDRDATRQLIRAVYETAPNQVKLIYFNDPVLISEGLVERYPRHADHIHVRYCEVGHGDARYRCEAPALGSTLPEGPPARLSEPTGPVLVASASSSNRL